MGDRPAACEPRGRQQLIRHYQLFDALLSAAVGAAEAAVRRRLAGPTRPAPPGTGGGRAAGRSARRITPRLGLSGAGFAARWRPAPQCATTPLPVNKDYARFCSI